MEKTGVNGSTLPNGFDHELEFWKGFVKTERFLNGWARPVKTPELNQFVADFVSSIGGQVLDVGSGAVSILYGVVPQDKLIAYDPLGDEYTKIFDYPDNDIFPPLPIGAEDITDVEQFDIVHCSNALDHCQNPHKAFNQMLRAVRPGGYLIIQGFENEGKFENYTGLHQWNIFITHDGKMRIENRQREFTEYVTNKSTGVAKRIKLDTGKDWFIFIVKK